MHFDHWFEKRIAKTSFDLPSITNEVIVKKMTRKRSDNDCVSILFMPWQAGELIQTWIMKSIPKNRDVISISPESLLLSDALETSKLSLQVCEKALDTVQHELNEKNYKHINIVGLSVGTGIAAFVSNRLYKKYNLDYVDLVCPGAELSTSLWHGSRTINLRKKYEDSGHTLEDIQKLLSQVDLINNLDFAKTIPLRISYSASDIVIIPAQTEKVIESLKGNTLLPISIHKNKYLGHYLTMFRAWLVWRMKYQPGINKTKG